MLLLSVPLLTVLICRTGSGYVIHLALSSCCESCDICFKCAQSADNDEVYPAFLHSAPTYSVCRAGLTSYVV